MPICGIVCRVRKGVVTAKSCAVIRAQLRKAPHAIKRLNVNSAMALHCVPIDISICEQINRILRKYQSCKIYLFSHHRIAVCVQCHTRRSSTTFRNNYLSSLPVFNILCRVIINIIPKCECLCACDSEILFMVAFVFVVFGVGAVVST